MVISRCAALLKVSKVVLLLLLVVWTVDLILAAMLWTWLAMKICRPGLLGNLLAWWCVMNFLCSRPCLVAERHRTALLM